MAQARNEKYKYGKIYAIVENKEDIEELIYIGSTFQKLNNRYVNHLESAKNENNKKYNWQMYRYTLCVKCFGKNIFSFYLTKKIFSNFFF